MLFNTPRGPGRLPTTRNNPAENANSAEADRARPPLGISPPYGHVYARVDCVAEQAGGAGLRTVADASQ